MAGTEAQAGEFTLVFNGPNGVQPVVLTKEKHELLQGLLVLVQPIYVDRNVLVKYERPMAEEEHF